MKRTLFKTDPELMVLIQPMDRITFLKLQDDIIHGGHGVTIYVWNDILIGGIEEYDICCSLNRPFNVRRLAFMDKYEAASFICEEQLKRNDLKPEIKKYLFGKRYECELKKISTTSDSSGDAVYKRPGKKAIAADIGMPFALVPGTILKYYEYKTAIDCIRAVHPEIAGRILSGQLKVSHANAVLLGNLTGEEMRQIASAIEEYDIDHLSTADISRSLQWKQHGKHSGASERMISDEPLIRKMPEYDPDSEICSLVLTIPSWIGSISKAVSQSDLGKSSPTAINRLNSSLCELKNAIAMAESAVKEVHRNG